MTLLALAAVSVLFALNIGGSGLAPSFAAVQGAGLIGRGRAALLYLGFVAAGALLLGGFVARTLGSELVPAERFTPLVALCVLGGATFALMVANLLRIPQSTSWVTVFSIVAAGVYLGEVRTETIFRRLLPAWVLLPVLGFCLATLAARALYPMRPANFRLHELLARNERWVKRAALATSCWVALSIGSNNVANVVGPLSGAGVVDPVQGFLLAAPLVGLGALAFPAPARTVSREIVPIGLLAATIANLVTGSIIVLASWLGIPQSLVHVNTAAVAAISLVKEEDWRLMRHSVLRRFGAIWLVTPALAALLTLAALSGARWLLVR